MTERSNGGEPNGPPINIINPIVQALEEIVDAARAGQIHTFGMVGINPHGAITTLSLGGRQGDLYVGLGLLQRKIEDQMIAPPTQSGPRIIRATGAI